MFCGAGGFAEGARQAGFQNIWSVDNDTDSCISFGNNQEGTVYTMEIEEFTRKEHLKKLGKMFDNNWELALAGYNGGPGYMVKEIKSQGTRNFWKLKLRKETHEYVPKFLAMLNVARERYPELYFQGSPRAWATSS